MGRAGNWAPSLVPEDMTKQTIAGLSPLGPFAKDQAKIVNARIQSGNREGVINQQTSSLERCFRRLACGDEQELVLELATMDGTILVTMKKV